MIGGQSLEVEVVVAKRPRGRPRKTPEDQECKKRKLDDRDSIPATTTRSVRKAPGTPQTPSTPKTTRKSAVKTATPAPTTDQLAPGTPGTPKTTRKPPVKKATAATTDQLAPGTPGTPKTTRKPPVKKVAVPTTLQIDDVPSFPAHSWTRSNFSRAKQAVLTRLSGRAQPLQVVGLKDQYEKVYGVLARTVLKGEGNSIVVAGGRGVGKTVMIMKALQEVTDECAKRDEGEETSEQPFWVIRLDAAVQTDDRMAMREIVRQILGHTLDTQTLDGTESIGSFADCFDYVLNTLSSRGGKQKPIIFILENICRFATHAKQALLYSLFDASQSRTPLCVVGVTRRIDFTDLLEKRVKSRFSGRGVYCWGLTSGEGREEVVRGVVGVSVMDGVDRGAVLCWNQWVEDMLATDWIKRAMSRVQETSGDVRRILDIFTPYIRNLTHTPNQRLQSTLPPLLPTPSPLRSLSPLELLLLLAMADLERNQSAGWYNFEMVYEAYTEVVRKGGVNSAGVFFVRDVAFKAFEHLIFLELIRPVSASTASASLSGTVTSTTMTGSKCPKEYRMVKSTMGVKELVQEVKALVAGGGELPGAVGRWVQGM
ncbi:origin recognition complex subunit 4 C-terminus-domain-containing protein [Phlyctochytrium arcticum]|nr:origin recognition complex subunit 4 C-terminus-domain-containing protein [Phlyctochytrium arcticum]